MNLRAFWPLIGLLLKPIPNRGRFGGINTKNEKSPNSTLVMAYMSLHGKNCNIFKVSSYGNALEAHFGQLL